jgi:REP element-mobilizing transposase RayT
MAILAYHLTWTCYGQWLHGDARGYVDRAHRTPGAPYEHNHPERYNAAATRMKEEAVWLSDSQRKTVARAIREGCRYCGWRLVEQNVQPDHVHVVVEAQGVTGKYTRKFLKAWATRRLGAEGAGRRHRWTKGGKVEVIREAIRLRQAAAYVREQPFPRVEEG